MENKHNVDGSVVIVMKNGESFDFGLWKPINFKGLISAENDINSARDMLVNWLNDIGFKSHEIEDIKIHINYS